MVTISYRLLSNTENVLIVLTPAHDRWNPFRCPKCDFKCPSGQELSAHVKEKHENPEEEAAQAVLEKINEVSRDNKKRWTAQRRRGPNSKPKRGPLPCTCKKSESGEKALKTDPEAMEDQDGVDPDWQMAECAVMPDPPTADGGRNRPPPCTCKKSGNVRRRGRPPRNAARWSDDFEEEPSHRRKRRVAPPTAKSLATRLRDIPPGLEIMKAPDASRGRPRRGIGRAYYMEEEGEDDFDDGDYDFGVGFDPLDNPCEDEDNPVLDLPVECALKEEPAENGVAHELQTASVSRIAAAAAATNLPDLRTESVFREEASKGDRLLASMAMLRDFLSEQGVAGYDLTVLKRFEALVKTNLSKCGLENGDKERLAQYGGPVNNLNVAECHQNGQVEVERTGTMPTVEKMDGVEGGSQDECQAHDENGEGDVQSHPGEAGESSEYAV